ncbi:MAG TPA: PBP1A family penicillin-binding protein, partial [Longimicrobiaceae bacterium]|nr:PBP1A family penicillin-binding protein [Longimicrobiaceae bacterium]
MPADQEPVRNLYRPGPLGWVKSRWQRLRDGWRAFRADPRAGLRAELARDRAAAASALRGLRDAVAGAWARRWGRRAILGAFALFGFLLTFSWERCGLTGCPSVARLASFQPGGAPIVYDARGGVLAELSPTRWAVVRVRDLPEHVPAAFVAVEDKRFYQHRGVDWRRFFGSMLRNLRPGARAQGASTITMQVARNVFPDRLPASERTIRRKLLEIRVAREIEQRLSKEEILQLYLNHIYFGEGVYGIESASRIYFGKHAVDLKLSEAALLAGLPKAPTHYNPRRNLARSLQRRNLVLALMRQQGLISPEAEAQARAATPRLARWQPERKRRRAPYFVEQVRRVMEDRFGEELYSGALRIHTPLDPGVQAAAERALERQLARIEDGAFGRFDGPRRSAFEPGSPETPYLQGATVVMEAETGDVLALVGGRDFAESRFDRMLQGFRQPGSAFKPFVYAAAVDAGIPPTERIEDAPLRRELPGGEVWEPRNFDGRFRGPVSVRRSLRESVNTVAVRLAERVGVGRVRATARRMGITTPIPQLPSIAIGASAVRPMELAAAYSAFATLGRRAEPRWVLRVEDRDGKTLWEPGARRRRVLDAATAFVVTSLMRDVVDRGTGRRAREAGVRGPAAGKTGTTNGATDAWFVGVTPRLVAAVWIGFDRPRPILREGSGGELAAPVWGRIIRAAQTGTPAAWEPPSGVVERRVVSATGAVIAPGCSARGETYTEVFLRRALPEETCPAGAPYGGGIGGWLRRKLDEFQVGLEDWAADALDRAMRSIGEALEGGGREPSDAPAPREEPPPPRDETEEAPSGTPDIPAEEEEPRIRLPRFELPDTLVIPDIPEMPDVRLPDTLVIPVQV